MIPDIKLETELWTKGYKIIIGLDEAGRGPWAGPVTAGGVVIDKGTQILPSIKDSKKMSKKKREEVYQPIKDSVVAWGIGEVSAEEIDKIGIQQAVKKAMTSVVHQIENKLNKKADFLIIDGSNVLDVDGYESIKIIKGDLKHYSISAGSILAKVHHDHRMYEYAKLYPDYGFENHVGYGTKAHNEALHLHGPTPIHRKSYKPIRELIS